VPHLASSKAQAAPPSAELSTRRRRRADGLRRRRNMIGLECAPPAGNEVIAGSYMPKVIVTFTQDRLIILKITGDKS
jgi:hypothetical protein